MMSRRLTIYDEIGKLLDAINAIEARLDAIEEWKNDALVFSRKGTEGVLQGKLIHDIPSAISMSIQNQWNEETASAKLRYDKMARSA